MPRCSVTRRVTLTLLPLVALANPTSSKFAPDGFLHSYAGSAALTFEQANTTEGGRNSDRANSPTVWSGVEVPLAPMTIHSRLLILTRSWTTMGAAGLTNLFFKAFWLVFVIMMAAWFLWILTDTDEREDAQRFTGEKRASVGEGDWAVAPHPQVALPACYHPSPQQTVHCGADEKVVIGLTGISGSGKSWLAKGLHEALEAMGKNATIVGQGDFLFQACQVKRGHGIFQEKFAAECTNHEKFAIAIKDSISAHDIVIAQGPQLLHHSRVTGMLDYIFLIELGKDEARHRRTQPRDLFNPNPLKPEDFDELLWPAHQTYMKDKVAPLQEFIVQLQSPTNAAQRDDLVQGILHAAGLAKPISHTEFWQAHANSSTYTPQVTPRSNLPHLR